MKIIVTAEGPDLESAVDPRFGRAAFYILVDTENMKHVALDNERGRTSQQGAGVQAAQRVADTGAEALLTGHCGPKAHQTLSAAGIKVYSNQSGSVQDAVERLVRGEVAPSTKADVEGHWQ